jgi:hypothetical protein
MSKNIVLDKNLNEITERLKLNSGSESSQTGSPKQPKKVLTQKKIDKEPSANKSTSHLQPSLDQFMNKAKKKPEETGMKLIELIAAKRKNLFKNVLDFSFNKKRVRILTKTEEVSEKSGGILYWMSREQRVQDNWSLLFAQRLAMKQNIQLHVCFNLVPKFQDATIRHYFFMIEGLKEVEKVKFSIYTPYIYIHGKFSKKFEILEQFKVNLWR